MWSRNSEFAGISILRTISVFPVVFGKGVLPLILFTIYDRLLLDLKEKGVRYFWGHHFLGALACADDVVFLAPSASGLRVTLHDCEDFASSNGLPSNPFEDSIDQIQFL